MRVYKDWENLKVYIVGIGYETSHEEIFRACDGWVGHVDGMVWGDGRFDFFDAPNDFSENGWLDAAEKRYKDKCDFIGYQYSGRQIDKRQMYLDLAGKAGADIAIAVDTDEYVDPKRNDFDTFYRNTYYLMKALPDRIYYQWIYIPSKKLWPKQGNAFPSNVWRPSAKIHINPGSMRFCMQKHYVWCKKNVDDNKLIQWQLKHRDQDNPYQFHPRITIDGVRIRMDRTFRNEEFNKKQAQWAFLNQHAENSREFYAVSQAVGNPPPAGFSSWEEWEKKPHTFDKITGQRIEL